jgi:hypothetical protein
MVREHTHTLLVLLISAAQFVQVDEGRPPQLLQRSSHIPAPVVPFHRHLSPSGQSNNDTLASAASRARPRASLVDRARATPQHATTDYDDAPPAGPRAPIREPVDDRDHDDMDMVGVGDVRDAARTARPR